MSEWISVEDRLPECWHEYTSEDIMISDTVLITDRGDRTSLGMGHMRENGTWDVYGGEHDFMHPENITHWMKLPEPPK